MSVNNQDYQDAEDEYLNGFGRGEHVSDDEGHGDDDEEEPLADVYSDDLKLASMNPNFHKVTSKLWQARPIAVYDDHGAGPRNMPDRVRSFSPLQIFMLFFPLALAQAVVAQTNLYYVQTKPPGDKLAPFFTVREFFTWLGLHIKMLRTWCGRQNQFWTENAPFNAGQYMSRRRFFWIKANLHFADKEQRPRSGR